MSIYITQIINFITDNKWWIIQIFVVVLTTITLSYLVQKLLKRLEAKALRTNNVWDESVLVAANNPLRALIWLLGIAFAADIAHQQSGAAIFSLVTPIRQIGVVGIITWFLIKAINELQTNYINKQHQSKETLDTTTLTAISNLGKISILITAALVSMQSMGYSISGVLAFGGIGGIAIGFAAKDMLANLFGSLIIFLDRPFKIGEWIRSPDREIEGTVEQIGWRMTVIRTFSKNPIYVPNSVFSTIAIENPSRMTNRRIHETIGIRYRDFNVIDSITSDVKEMLIAHPEIDKNLTLMVNFNQFGPSSLDIFIYAFTKTTAWEKYHEIKQDVLLKIGNIIEKKGAEVAFPTSTVHIQV
jgi:MscS family membrane protein